MKKFFGEFKKFILRGNVVDMAVGVIVGGAFTGVVNGMSNYILKPIINYFLALIFGAETLTEVYTMLKPVLDEAGAIDLENSIYINWGEFINAVINFLLIALVLFCIVKFMNHIREIHKNINGQIYNSALTKEDKKILKSRGIKLRNKKAVAAYLEEKAQAEKEAADEAARLAREANQTTEDLLKQILAELKNK